MAYERIEPFGEDRGDLRAGIVASTIANAHRSKGKRAFKPSEFMPEFGKECEPQTWQEMKEIARMLNLAFGGEEKPRGDNR